MRLSVVLKIARQGIPIPYITNPISGQYIPNTTMNTLQLIVDNYFPKTDKLIIGKRNKK